MFSRSSDFSLRFETDNASRRGLPEGLAAQFLPSAGDCQIKYVYEIALGANGSYYAGWRGKDGKNYSREPCHNLSPSHGIT